MDTLMMFGYSDIDLTNILYSYWNCSCAECVFFSVVRINQIRVLVKHSSLNFLTNEKLNCLWQEETTHKSVTLWLLTVRQLGEKARSANQLNIYIEKLGNSRKKVGKPKLHVANGNTEFTWRKGATKKKMLRRHNSWSIYLELLTALLLPTGIFCTDPLFATLVALLELFTLFDRFDCCCVWYEFTDAWLYALYVLVADG